MIIILHGDDQVRSRQRLLTLKDLAKQQGKEIISLDGKGIDRTILIQSFESPSLFSIPKLVVMENLIGSLRTGTSDKDQIIDYLLSGKFDSDVILWEGKSVGKSLLKLKKQPHVSVEDFKLPVVIFKLTEALTPDTIPDALRYLHESLKTNPIEVVYVMIVRQFRLMMATILNASIPETDKLIPWVRNKLVRQTSMFSKNQLKILYKELLMIDYQTKTGTSAYDLTKRVEQFIMKLEKYDEV